MEGGNRIFCNWLVIVLGGVLDVMCVWVVVRQDDFAGACHASTAFAMELARGGPDPR